MSQETARRPLVLRAGYHGGLPSPMANPMAELHDTIRSARGGDVGAFDTLFARALPRLRAFIRMRAGGVAIARESVSDLAQSVCREVLVEIDQFEFRGEPAFRALLFRRAVQKILKRRRFHRQARRDLGREVTGDDDELFAGYATMVTPSRNVSAREQLMALDAALAELPEVQRDALAMSRILGMSYTEVAEQLDKSESAVRGLVARGLAVLARRCAKGGE